MKIKKITGLWLSALSLMLCLVMLLQVPVSAAETHLNYGKGLSGDKTLSASELFEALFTSEAKLTAAETKALDALAEVSLTHSRVPDSAVRREYDSTTEVLTILVDAYEYTAQNGETVTWKPTTVSFNGGTPKQLQPRADGVYVCTFAGLKESQTFTLDVDFVWEVMIQAEIADKLLALPYTVGKNAYDQLVPYETYQAELKAYEDYLAAKKQYPIDKAAYEEYLVKKAAYDEKKAAYDTYIAAKAAYDAAVAAYKENEAKRIAYNEAEAKYFAYQDFRAQYAAFYDQYEIYARNVKKMEEQLKVLESVYIHVTGDPSWGYYLSIKGPTATSFLDALAGKEAATGISRALIDEARNASQTLKNLLVEYDGIRSKSYASDFEKTRAKYLFYAEHYGELCSTLKVFYQDMKAIFCTDGIPLLVDAKGKTRQMEIMIAQSYALWTAMDDSATMDPNWRLNYGKKSLSLNDILYEQHRLTDANSASPKTVTVPETEMILPDTHMEPVEKPVKNFDENMTDPSLSGAPTPVANPGNAPAVVKDPGNPPTEVLKPEGECPAKPVLTAEETALVNEIKQGVLKKREAKGTDQLLSLHYTVSCQREISNRKIVTFYDYDGTKLREISVDYGEMLSLYADQIPPKEKAGDERYSAYYFLGWVYYGSTGNNYLDLNSIRVRQDLEICPVYETVDRYYKVVWIANGTTKTEYYSYGKIPTCSLSTDRAPDGPVSYEFIGWSPAVSAVTGDVTYIATYDEKRPAYTVTWIVGDKTVTNEVLHGYVPIPVSAERETDDFIYEFIGWDQTLMPATGDITYRANYTAIPLAKYNDGSVCRVEHTDSAVILKPTQLMLWIDQARDYALENNKSLVVQWSDFSVTFTAEQLRTMQENYCCRLELKRESGEYAETVLYRIIFRNEINHAVNLKLPVAVRVFRASVSGRVGMICRVEDGVRTPIEVERFTGELRFEAETDTQILYLPEYFVKYSDPTENSNLTALPTQVSQGETVDLTVNCEYGYEVVGAVLTYADGRTETVIGTQFTMPGEPITVELQVERIVFDVTFVVEGVVYREESLYFGDAFVLPENPVKAEDEQYTYSFSGWSPQIWNSAVYLDDRSPVFTAVFTAHPKSVTVAEEYRGSFVTRIIVIGVSFAVLAVGTVLCIIHRKRVIPFVRRVIRGFMPFVKKCCGAVREKTVMLWNRMFRKS